MKKRPIRVRVDLGTDAFTGLHRGTFKAAFRDGIGWQVHRKEFKDGCAYPGILRNEDATAIGRAVATLIRACNTVVDGAPSPGDTATEPILQRVEDATEPVLESQEDYGVWRIIAVPSYARWTCVGCEFPIEGTHCMTDTVPGDYWHSVCKVRRP